MNNGSLPDSVADFQPIFRENWGYIAKLKTELGHARREASWARSNWQNESHAANRRIAALEAECARLRAQNKVLAAINALALSTGRQPG